MKIIFVSLDTVRANHLGCYGYSKPTSPYMDHIASQGVLFEQAIASDIPTEAAHTAMFTGRPGISTGVVAHGADGVHLSKQVGWLPQLLRKSGMTTAAVDNMYNLKEWFCRGYEYYINTAGATRWIDGINVNKKALPWIRGHKEEDFFLFLHYWDAHTPYMDREAYTAKFYKGDPFSAKNQSMEKAYKSLAYPFFKLHHYDHLGPVTDADYVSALYGAEIRYLDDRLKELDDTLWELGIAEDTLLVLVGDHGESMTEHEIYWDHCGLYDATVHIPCIMRWPGRIPAGSRIKGQVQHTDLMPTLLEALNMPIPQEVQGKSLWPLIRGEKTEAHETVFLSECAWQASRGLRTEQWKYIHTYDPGCFTRAPRELYNLRSDPEEKTNLAEIHPQLSSQFEDQLQNWVQSQLAGRKDPMFEQIEKKGLPFRKRLEKIMIDHFGSTWEEWICNPDPELLKK
ncbi:MAG TPA: sulfatase [Bacilli bacterium]